MADLYAILGLPPTADTAEIRQAYARLARERHPDRFQDPAQKKEAESFFKDLTQAFNVLSNERTRREYDQERQAPRRTAPEEIAQEAFARGQAHMEARQPYEAVECFRVAVHHVPGEARYQAALGRALARNPQWLREAAEAYEEALRLDPRQAGACAELARLYLARGLKLRARKLVEAGLQQAPRDQALQALAAETVDQGPAPPGEGGGLRGLLRRK